jgi:hypothetical protein
MVMHEPTGRIAFTSVQTWALIRSPDGRLVELVPGDIIGRSTSAALPVDEGRVSEAHAMVSLREGQLQLLPLRGGLALGGEPVSHVVLTPGAVVQLADGVELTVMEAHLPLEVLGIEGRTLPRQMLPAVASILAGARPRLVGGWREDALAQLWSTGEGFRLKTSEGTREVAAGDGVTVNGHELHFVAIPLGEAGPRTTRRVGDFADPLHIMARFDTVQVHRDGRAPVIFSGMQARLVTELVSVDGPVTWGVLSSELWPDEDDSALRRGRLDALLMRVRRRLRATGIRSDLIRSDGAGTVELVRYPNDRIEDLA